MVVSSVGGVAALGGLALGAARKYLVPVCQAAQPSQEPAAGPLLFN